MLGELMITSIRRASSASSTLVIISINFAMYIHVNELFSAPEGRPLHPWRGGGLHPTGGGGLHPTGEGGLYPRGGEGSVSRRRGSASRGKGVCIQGEGGLYPGGGWSASKGMASAARGMHPGRVGVCIQAGVWGSASRGRGFASRGIGGLQPKGRILWDMVNEQVVHILLECILVLSFNL